MPQRAATQVAVPLSGAGHGLHEVPHDVVAVFDAQMVPQAWVPTGHMNAQRPP
jgi:hypothetical protein